MSLGTFTGIVLNLYIALVHIAIFTLQTHREKSFHLLLSISCCVVEPQVLHFWGELAEP